MLGLNPQHITLPRQTPSDPGRQTYWGGRIFIAVWIAYAGFYFCRKNIAWTPMTLTASSHSFSDSLAKLLLFFGLGYGVGQFTGGFLTDRYGPRRTLLAGGLISALCTAALLPGLPASLLVALQMVNGFGQGFGWPAINRLFRTWIPREERAIAMGWWSSSYALGSFLATAVATALSTISFIPLASGSRLSLLLPAVILFATTCFAYARVRDLPEPVPESHGLNNSGAADPISKAATVREGYGAIVRNSELRLLAAMYFFLKMTRYALLFWLPLYLLEAAHASARLALTISSFFELSGFIGAVLACYVSERLLQGHRYAIGTCMLLLAAFVLLLYPVAAMLGTVALMVATTLLGVLIFGPDLLLASTTVIDIVPIEESGRAAGFVNGIGSTGQMLSPVLVTLCANWFGWNSIFNIFVVCILFAGLLLAKRWEKV